MRVCCVISRTDGDHLFPSRSEWTKVHKRKVVYKADKAPTYALCCRKDYILLEIYLSLPLLPFPPSSSSPSSINAHPPPLSPQHTSSSHIPPPIHRHYSPPLPPRYIYPLPPPPLGQTPPSFYLSPIKHPSPILPQKHTRPSFTLLPLTYYPSLSLFHKAHFSTSLLPSKHIHPYPSPPFQRIHISHIPPPKPNTSPSRSCTPKNALTHTPVSPS